MSRIPLVEPEQASPAVQETYKEMEAIGFPLLNVMKMFGNHAGINEGFLHFAKALYANETISTRYRELAYLRASQINHCHY